MKANLSSELISQFVNVTTDKKKSNESITMYGTIVQNGEQKYVKIDGSEMVTPVDTTAIIKDGDRVTIVIKNHTAIVTGNLYLGSIYWVFPYKPSTASGLVVTIGQCEWDTGASWVSVTHIYSDQVKVYVTDIAQRPAGPVYFQAHVFGKWK